MKSSEIMGPSDVFGKLRKISKIVAKCVKKPSSIFDFFKSSEIVGSVRKSSEKVGKFSKRSSDNLKILKIFGSVRKCSEMLGILWRPSENF